MGIRCETVQQKMNRKELLLAQKTLAARQIRTESRVSARLIIGLIVIRSFVPPIVLIFLFFWCFFVFILFQAASRSNSPVKRDHRERDLPSIYASNSDGLSSPSLFSPTVRK